MADTTITLTMPDAAAMQTRAQSRLDLARSIKITTPALLAEASAELGDLKTALAKLEERRKEITRPLDAAKASTMALFRGPGDLLQQGIDILEAAIKAFYRQQEQARLAAQRVAEQAAAEERRKLAEQAREGERQAAEAARLGNMAEATQLANDAALVQATAAMVVAAPTVEAIPLPKGTTISKHWKARVTNKKAALDFIIEHRATLGHLLMIDEDGLNAMAKAMESNFNIPGAEAFNDPTIRSKK